MLIKKRKATTNVGVWHTQRRRGRNGPQITLKNKASFPRISNIASRENL
jgi:hypothetical protein